MEEESTKTWRSGQYWLCTMSQWSNFFFTWCVIYPLPYPLHNCVSLFSDNLSWSLLITYFENVCWLVLCQVYIKMWKSTMCITGVCVFTLEAWCWDFCKVSKGPLPLKPSDLLLLLVRNCISDLPCSAGVFFACTKAGLSKVAGCWQKSPPTWLVLAGYSAWHFFTDGTF